LACFSGALDGLACFSGALDRVSPYRFRN